MGLSFEDEIHTPKSTGAVKFDPPRTTTVDHYGETIVVRQETPGPVTMNVSWKPEAKVVTPEDQPEPVKSRKATTKSGGR